VHLCSCQAMSRTTSHEPLRLNVTTSRYCDSSHEWACRHGFREPTYVEHVQQIERGHDDRRAKTVRERNEPLHMLITKAAAKSIRDITGEANAEMPQDNDAAHKVVNKSPNSGVGLMIASGSSLEGVATFIAKRTLERWIRVLKPFASGPGLAVLIARLVHEDYSRLHSPAANLAHRWGGGSPGSPSSSSTISIVPPPYDLLGNAFRQLTPLPDDALTRPWVFIEDMEAALSLEGQFNVNPDHPLRPNSLSPTRRTPSTMSRPPSVASLQVQSPKGMSGPLRRSASIPWSDFQPDNGFRQTTMCLASHKQLRKFPGPDTYGDVAKIFTAPQRASFGRFPPVGDRRTRCTCTPLSQLPRYFDSDHVIAS